MFHCLIQVNLQGDHQSIRDSFYVNEFDQGPVDSLNEWTELGINKSPGEFQNK